jgi:hypothetical protein
MACMESSFVVAVRSREPHTSKMYEKSLEKRLRGITCKALNRVVVNHSESVV